MPDPTRAPAIFLDRDGTIIADPGYVSLPQQVQLLPGAAEAIKRLSAAGYRVVLVSNQSGVARGLFTEEDLAAVQTRLVMLLKAEGAELDGAYYCPFLDGPDATVPAYQRDSYMRKPNPGMLLQAAEELNIDLSRSWMIGDSPRDVEAGRRAGCRTILLRSDGAADADGCRPTMVAGALADGADLIEQRGYEHSSGSEGPLVNDQTDRVVTLLEGIRNQLDHGHRQSRQQDFSVRKLFAALLQMLAVVSALWGLAALLDERDPTAAARFLLACFFQLAVLAAIAVDRLP